ncbi:MAG: FAD-dependent oxidoreductase [Deltaproteobacteria bacterium]|nr:FAD-dependent oxidoreductase [Deltaproteobacteria bacterium]
MDARVGILGGGIAGVSLQRFLSCSSEVLEKEQRLGGLCRSFEKEGFRYDIGGHILFSKHHEINQLVAQVLDGNIRHCRRNNRILFKGKYVKYPFENGLGILEREDIFDCLIKYLNNPHRHPATFREWIYYTFGDGIANRYLVPYNEKIWKTPLDEMALGWVERIPRPPLEDVVKSALGFETEGYQHQLNFNYPLNGGFESLVHSLRKTESQSVTGFEVRRVWRGSTGWYVSNEVEVREYDRLVVTLPVTEAVKVFEGVPESVREAAARLRRNRVRVVMVGVNNTSLTEIAMSALYIPDPTVAAHRVCFMGFFSPNNVPLGRSSLIAEITTNPSTDLHTTSDGVLVERVVEDLHRLALLDRKDVVVTDIKNFDYGYPVYDSSHEELTGQLRSYFSSLGVDLLGRFGEFLYINSDEVIRRAMALAERLNKDVGGL